MPPDPCGGIIGYSIPAAALSSSSYSSRGSIVDNAWIVLIEKERPCLVFSCPKALAIIGGSGARAAESFAVLQVHSGKSLLECKQK
jgi:hypothetical protein